MLRKDRYFCFQRNLNYFLFNYSCIKRVTKKKFMLLLIDQIVSFNAISRRTLANGGTRLGVGGEYCALLMER